MAFIQYLTFDGTALPLPDSYEVQMDDVRRIPAVRRRPERCSGMWCAQAW